jgi:hypothetical protein
MTAAIVDAAGVEHPQAAADARIVSLVPSITELLFALGVGARVVGRTGFCIHPREPVRSVPKVGGTKAVKLDTVRSLRPTHVIVNIDENEKATIDALAAFVPHIVVRDTYISAMLRLVNWQTWPPVTGGLTGAARYPIFDLSALWLADVDVVLLSTEPYRFTDAHRQALAADSRVASKTVRLIDGELVSWYGSRAIEGVEYLRRLALE